MTGLHLAAEITISNVRFVTFRNGTVVQAIQETYSGKTDIEIKHALSAIFQENALLQDDFEEVTVAWCEDKSSLVPNSIFNESKPSDIFKLCFGNTSENDEIDYNRISELSAINVYHVPNWLKAFFVMRFPRVIIQHAGTHIIRKILSENAFQLKATVVCFENYFQLTIVKHNALEFYSSFNYQNADDVIYQLSFALQQKELLNEKGSIELITSIGSESSLIEEIERGLQKIGDFKQMNIRSDKYYLSKSQLLCV
ncbi:MAG: DUF3822 family protein [Crocinitomicaceae bacterium]|jgi:hypothetical protein|nr:DUF3822 family protein [Crocinitomicaceae bacterium]MDG1035769.1 DUF3822 family protein [Crocinitomicaceae bacterium]MDG1742398.1 DUF3822 family protein [Crocinitomicaceae bacterium]